MVHKSLWSVDAVGIGYIYLSRANAHLAEPTKLGIEHMSVDIFESVAVLFASDSGESFDDFSIRVNKVLSEEGV